MREKIGNVIGRGDWTNKSTLHLCPTSGTSSARKWAGSGHSKLRLHRNVHAHCPPVPSTLKRLNTPEPRIHLVHLRLRAPQGAPHSYSDLHMLRLHRFAPRHPIPISASHPPPCTPHHTPLISHTPASRTPTRTSARIDLLASTRSDLPMHRHVRQTFHPIAHIQTRPPRIA
ncbi:hypothetical protein B0H13DRAFT_2653893 [Mycena leptocephala]|nr:hypothetical protein B0H13DRAFT_2653893 [Mycena leptocephala]